jgi:hypothetical protein
MANELRGIYGGPSADGNFVGAPLPGAVSERRIVGSYGPPKSAGLIGAPMMTDPHAADRTGGPSFTPELRADLQKLPAAARRALLRR